MNLSFKYESIYMLVEFSWKMFFICSFVDYEMGKLDLTILWEFWLW